MIHLNNVTRTFSNLKAISQVDLVISQGDIIGVVGKNGAGKTTLLKMIAGNLQPSEGSILVNGEDIFIRGQKYKYNVGFSSGNTSGLYMKMSVWDNITFFASMFRVPTTPCPLGVKFGTIFIAFSISRREGVSVKYMTFSFQ